MNRRIRTSEHVQERAKELRRTMTPAERRLWPYLRGRALGGFKFRRQHPLGPFIADFYCAECRLVVEIDGPIHIRLAEQDAVRTAQFADYGYHVIRFTNDQVENDLPAVLQAILEACRGFSPSPLPPAAAPPPPSPLPNSGEGKGAGGWGEGRRQSYDHSTALSR